MKIHGFILLVGLFVAGSVVAQSVAPQVLDLKDSSSMVKQEELDALVRGFVDFDQDPDALNKALVELDNAKSGLTLTELAKTTVTMALLKLSLAAEDASVRMATFKKDVVAIAAVVHEHLKKAYAKANAHVVENKKAYVVGGSIATLAVVLALIIYLSNSSAPVAA
jgi:hypothetical protein